MQSKFCKLFSKISFIFVTVYAVLGIILTVFFEVDFLNEFLAPIKIMHLIFPLFAIAVCFSWPFFGPVALGTLLVKFIFYKRNKPENKKPYIKDMILHLVFSLVGMAGIFCMYYDKFGMPDLF